MPIDYKSIGFKCGLEIHQRLATSTKLFCSCPNASASDTEIAKVERQQRAVAGELGSTDRSSKFEESKKRRFIYAVPSGTSCLVELDEEPPHDVSREAIGIALSVARGLGMEIFDELEPMRKEVVDGSDTSAFQRTIMVGMNGEIKVNGMRIAIPFASLEEESSGIIENNDEYALYDISRLGVPLIEIDTSPDIPSPAAAKDVALHIGTLLRLTGKVQRGIGSIRQDVNVSIKDGSRVEIKGLQEVGAIAEYIENEVKRQLALVAIMAELKSRKAGVGSPKDVTKVFSGTASQLIKRSLSTGGKVIGIPLYKFEGIIGRELGEGRRLGTEISEYAKMSGVKGIIHGD
ncbi:MAG: Glu-tRNA(Gln) amidotransferase subunit GatE, partial [Candidatus Marsarchaeota archaeon]|nr:Glu-tRNA(Gln) amidotransferase subunit GatE [Candidatus Marsarchaeota archaeon]